jgi:hypothetical protein
MTNEEVNSLILYADHIYVKSLIAGNWLWIEIDQDYLYMLINSDKTKTGGGNEFPDVIDISTEASDEGGYNAYITP